jgi:hypothetical protein
MIPGLESDLALMHLRAGLFDRTFTGLSKKGMGWVGLDDLKSRVSPWAEVFI